MTESQDPSDKPFDQLRDPAMHDEPFWDEADDYEHVAFKVWWAVLAFTILAVTCFASGWFFGRKHPEWNYDCTTADYENNTWTNEHGDFVGVSTAEDTKITFIEPCRKD